MISVFQQTRLMYKPVHSQGDIQCDNTAAVIQHRVLWCFCITITHSENSNLRCLDWSGTWCRIVLISFSLLFFILFFFLCLIWNNTNSLSLLLTKRTHTFKIKSLKLWLIRHRMHDLKYNTHMHTVSLTRWHNLFLIWTLKISSSPVIFFFFSNFTFFCDFSIFIYLFTFAVSVIWPMQISERLLCVRI